MNNNIKDEILFENSYLKGLYERVQNIREGLNTLCTEYVKREILSHDDWDKLLLVELADKDEFSKHINEFLEECDYDICGDSTLNVIYFTDLEASYENMCIAFSYDMNESYETNMERIKELKNEDSEETDDDTLLNNYMMNVHKYSNKNLPS